MTPNECVKYLLDKYEEEKERIKDLNDEFGQNEAYLAGYLKAIGNLNDKVNNEFVIQLKEEAPELLEKIMGVSWHLRETLDKLSIKQRPVETNKVPLHPWNCHPCQAIYCLQCKSNRS